MSATTLERKPLERKSFSLKLDPLPDEEGTFTGYAAVFGNVDKGNDVIEPGAVTKTLQDNPMIPLFWVHNYTLVPIGTGRLTLDRKRKGVRIEGKLLIETSELAREVYGAMKAGAVKGLSIGYNTVKKYMAGPIRHLQEIRIGETSLCPFPMNELAQVDGVKRADVIAGVKSLYGTQGVGCLLTMIQAGTEFLAEEVQERDEEDMASMQAVLKTLTSLLDSELGEVGTPEEEEAPDEQDGADGTGDLLALADSVKSLVSRG
jgi:HK97 family phage prohead protease